MYLGELDSTPRFYYRADLPPGPVKVRINYDLVLTDEYWQPGLGGGTATRVKAPAAWRIEGPEPEPHITVDTAIRYLMQIRTRAPDERTRKNADRAIASLKLQQ